MNSPRLHAIMLSLPLMAWPWYVHAKNPVPGAARPQQTQPSSVRVCHRVEEFIDRGGRPPITIHFDDAMPGTDLSACSMCGVTFAAVHAPLIVVRDDETFTPAGFQDLCGAGVDHRLHATSGAQVLSPGGPVLGPGPMLAVEDDDVVITFDRPVSAFGFDHLSQHADGISHTHIEVLDIDGRVLYSGTVPIGSETHALQCVGERRRLGSSIKPLDSDDHPHADFWGIVSDAVNIRQIRIDERDDNNVCPDSNIGIDSLRFLPALCGPVGDLNGDGIVNDADARLLLDHWGKQALTGNDGPRWCAADLDRDGEVGASDLTILMTHYD